MHCGVTSTSAIDILSIKPGQMKRIINLHFNLCKAFNDSVQHLNHIQMSMLPFSIHVNDLLVIHSNDKPNVGSFVTVRHL